MPKPTFSETVADAYTELWSDYEDYLSEHEEGVEGLFEQYFMYRLAEMRVLVRALSVRFGRQEEGSRILVAGVDFLGRG